MLLCKYNFENEVLWILHKFMTNDLINATGQWKWVSVVSSLYNDITMRHGYDLNI